MTRSSKRRTEAGRPALGVTTRLLAVALFPLLGLMAYVVPAVRDRIEVANRVAQVEQDVARLDRLLDLRTAVQLERTPSESKVRGRSMGFTVEQISASVRYDVPAALIETRAQVTEALEALGSDREAVDDERLLRVRALADGGTDDADIYINEHRGLIEALNQVIDPALITLRSDTLQIAGGERLAQVVDALQASNEAADATSRELTTLEKIYFIPLLGGDRDALERELIGHAAEADVAIDELGATSVPEIAEAWAAIDAKPSTRNVNAGIEAIISGNAPTESGPDGVRRLVEDSQHWIQYQNDLYLFPVLSADILQREATTLRSAVDEERRRSVLLAAVLASLAVLISVLFARSIARPLRRLASQANTLNGGDLDVDSRVEQGPREVVAASRAFGDLVANLRLLDAKARALAEGDFDAEVLSERVPGPLGDSLQASVAAMASSRDEREALQRHVVHQATHDALTGLHNRAAATELLDQALARAGRSDDQVAALLVDLDSFQRMNDTFGSTVGDLVLVDVAARIKATVRSGDFVARLSSDEFLIIAEEGAGFGDITALAQDIATAIAQPIQVASATTVITACIGLAFTTDGSMDADQMLSSADLAVQRAKQRTPGSIEVFDEALQRTLVEHAATEDALRSALHDDGGLFMQYQPVVNLATGRLSGAEALIRWNRPDQGLQPPDSFIPVAEATNLIIELDRWVVARVARQMQAWGQQGLLDDVRIAVNISGRHLRSHDLLHNVRAILAETGLAPQRLVLEVTETALIDDLATAAVQLAELRAMGVRVALDDFGTGFTSITHLQQLPVDVIKIDRSFVDRAGNDRDRTLLAMIIDLAHHLGLIVTAEGVETEEQLQILRELGCDQAQGYLLSRPVDADVLVAEWTESGRVDGDLVPYLPPR